jgi:hypothetical protein
MESLLRGGALGLSPNASRGAPADEQAADELVLYIDNTNGLALGSSQGQGKSIRENLLRKVKAGKYDHELAIKGVLYVVETGAKQYAREFSDLRQWSTMFPPATRYEAARQLVESFESEYVNLRQNGRSSRKTRWAAVYEAESGPVLLAGGRTKPEAEANSLKYLREEGLPLDIADRWYLVPITTAACNALSLSDETTIVLEHGVAMTIGESEGIGDPDYDPHAGYGYPRDDR